MTTTPEEPLGDSDMTSEEGITDPMGSGLNTEGVGDADGTDGEVTDGDGTDGIDGDSTDADGTDADGTDGTDGLAP